MEVCLTVLVVILVFIALVIAGLIAWRIRNSAKEKVSSNQLAVDDRATENTYIRDRADVVLHVAESSGEYRRNGDGKSSRGYCRNGDDKSSRRYYRDGDGYRELDM